MTSSGEPFHYHLFVSYTRTPDGGLAREVERFLEGFHATLPPSDTGQPLAELRVCVDGSDFNLPPPEESDHADVARRDVGNVVREHLARSRELLVLCSRRAAASPWVSDEVRWFIEHRGAGSVRLAYTEGDDQVADPGGWFCAPLREAGLTGNIAYDLRGYDERRAGQWRQVADFNREMVRLAADLHGIARGDLYPTWLEGELARARSQSLELASSARFETLAGDPTRALLKAVEAHEIHPGPETEQALRDAYRVAVMHHYNRREVAQLTGAGPGYLAARWKQGAVFVKASPDGRHRVLVTERGRDGPQPPGTVYLVDNESQRVVELVAPGRTGARRVEEVAFDQDSRHVLVSRHFELAVYDLTGRVVGEYTFSRHTKSPVHVLAAWFHGRYVIGGETKGGLWLVDIHGHPDSTVEVLREFAGDPVLAIDIAPGGGRAALVFESARVALLGLDESGAPLLTDLPHPQCLHAGWTGDERLVTAGGDGVVRVWDLAGDAPEVRLACDPVPAAVDWVAFSEDRRRLCAVGSDRRLYVLDSEHGRLLQTLDHRQDIDWAGLRAVHLPEAMPKLPPVEAQAEAPWPSAELPVHETFELGDQTWLVTSEPGEGQYALPVTKAWRVEGDVARLYDAHAARVTRHLDLLWLHGTFSIEGRLLWLDGERLRRFPDDNVAVTVVTVDGDAAWVGSERGGWFHRNREHRLVTPADAKVHVIRVIDGHAWFGTSAGAYRVDDERTVRVSEDFLDVTDILEVAGQVWLRTRTDTGGFVHASGPAFVVEGCFARPLPDERQPAAAVLEAAGYAWVCGERALHRWDGRELRAIEGIEEPVIKLTAEDDGTLLAQTRFDALAGGAGPGYRVDPERLTATRL